MNKQLLVWVPLHVQPTLILVSTLVFLAHVDVVRAQRGDEDGNDMRPGLVAEFTGSDGRARRRVDSLISFDWSNEAPDRRLPPGGFTVQWHGQLVVRSAGAYEFSAYAAGAIRIEIDAQAVLDGKSGQSAWLDGGPMELDFGWHPLKITYLAAQQSPRLSLYWAGPGFQLEPLPERQLWHASRGSPPDDYVRGRQLVRALRCAGCHEMDDQPKPLPAPALDHLSGNLSPEWLVEWLTRSNDGHGFGDVELSRPIVRRMPSFGLDAADAEAIVRFLLFARDPSAVGSEPTRGDAKSGEQLFVMQGCLACHRVNDVGSNGLFDGGDLSQVAAKRTAAFFRQWLSDPSALNRDHRMPVFELTDRQCSDLAAYLQTLGAPQAANSEHGARPNQAAIEVGRLAVQKHRCSACHLLPTAAGTNLRPAAVRLTADSRWDRACTVNGEIAKYQPKYELAPADAGAIHKYIVQTAGQSDSGRTGLAGQEVLAERNCLMCHARGTSAGINAQFAAMTDAYPRLTARLPTMSPPSLVSVGDKLHDDWLRSAIRGAGQRQRPWLSIQMPRYDIPQDELHTLVSHLIATDRVPERQPTTSGSESLDGRSLQVAGNRLVTTDGFGCTSCHQVGSVMPPPGPPATRGANLTQLAQRVRRPWFDRWVRNPGLILPRVEMPAVQIPVAGVLQDDLDRQLDAVWHVLNIPGYNPPKPNALRVLRRHNNSEIIETARVLTDNVEFGKRAYVKPLLMALPNRHNVLFDLESYRLSGWTMGDAARQQLRGKYWYWESAASPLMTDDVSDCELSLVVNGVPYAPTIDPEVPDGFDTLEYLNAGVRFRARLHFPSSDRENDEVQLDVSQSFTPISGDSRSEGTTGFRREVEIQGVPRGASVRFRPHSGATVRLSDDGVTAHSGQNANYMVRIVTPRVRFESHQEATLTVMPQADGVGSVVLDYLTSSSVDRFPSTNTVVSAPPPEPLDVVPGFPAIVLPFSNEIMPTGLAWRRDGRLVFTSLKGRVWQARDRDGDGLEDDVAELGVELSAPYGVAVATLADGSEAIDVVDKTAALRLYDADDDGQADRVETLASGWGHSTDYHGWVVGLPRDEQGNYYVAVSQREGPTAHLRGRIVRLVSRTATFRDPRRLQIDSLATGMRFPLGIARSRSGILVATDNQGNYTPFNELNHIVNGGHYGFISEQDASAVSARPTRPPSIAIPHPWTRSVNGICFLETPPDVRTRLGGPFFGAFEGQLLGCEYDTRRLIRMSLQQVGDVWQGAAYPLSVPPTGGMRTFLGPIVCAVSPNGDVYVGSIRDSAWGSGNNIGEIVRMRFRQEELPTGIAEVTATSDGFRIDFSAPVDRQLAAVANNYSIESYRRTATPAYGGPDEDRRRERIVTAIVSDDARRVSIALKSLRTGYVYELQLKNLLGSGKTFFPSEAHFTLNAVPSRTNRTDENVD